MYVLPNACRATRLLKPSAILLGSSPHRPLSSLIQLDESSRSSSPHQNVGSTSSGMCRKDCLQMPQHPIYMMIRRTSFSYMAGAVDGGPTEAVKELYDKMLESVNVKKSMPPNSWLWSLIEKCNKHEDIELLFDVLKNLRRFRLSNLRIHDNFNCNLCREVAKTCASVGVLHFGKRTLWKHNIYGLSPTIASAHHLLSYAKKHKDTKLMVEIMNLVEKNDLPLQPGTADIVFSICYENNDWELISKFANKFIKGGAKLRRTTYDTWMEFAAKRGDTKSLWKIEQLRSESMKQHTLTSGFSCVKGFLLDHKPDDAAALIHVLDQTLPDTKKLNISVELQKLVNEWPLDVIKQQKEEDRKALAASLQSDIPAMVTSLLNNGIAVNADLENLTKKVEVLC